MGRAHYTTLRRLRWVGSTSEGLGGGEREGIGGMEVLVGWWYYTDTQQCSAVRHSTANTAGASSSHGATMTATRPARWGAGRVYGRLGGGGMGGAVGLWDHGGGTMGLGIVSVVLLNLGPIEACHSFSGDVPPTIVDCGCGCHL